MKGLEKVQWKTGGKDSTTFTGERGIYIAKFVVEELGGGLMKGHYVFPFSILLPNSLPSSMYIDKENFIGYFIEGFLPHLFGQG